MFGSKAIEPDVKVVFRFAYAAGTTGILSNLCLIIMYALLGLQGGSPEDSTLSWSQLVVFGVGILVGLPAYLGFPVWFVVLGRHLGASVG